MVSMADLRAISDDGFDDVFTYSANTSPTISPSVSPGPAKQEQTKMVPIAPEPENGCMAWDEKKLQAKEESLKDQSKVMPELSL